MWSARRFVGFCDPRLSESCRVAVSTSNCVVLSNMHYNIWAAAGQLVDLGYGVMFCAQTAQPDTGMAMAPRAGLEPTDSMTFRWSPDSGQGEDGEGKPLKARYERFELDVFFDRMHTFSIVGTHGNAGNTAGGGECCIR